MSFNKLLRLSAKNARETEGGKYTTSLSIKPLSNVNAIALKTVTFRNNVYNILDGVNELTFEASDGVTTVNATVTLPVGQYSVTQFMTELEILINAELIPIGATIEFELDLVSYKIGYTMTGGTYISFIDTSSMADIIGLSETTSQVLIGEFQNIPSLGGLTSVTVNIRTKLPMTILNRAENDALYTSSIGVVPVNVGFGLLQTYSQPDLQDAMLVFTHPYDLTNVQFQIRDPDGRLLTQQRNDLIIEIMVYYQN